MGSFNEGVAEDDHVGLVEIEGVAEAVAVGLAIRSGRRAGSRVPEPVDFIPRERFANPLIALLDVDQFRVGPIAGSLPGRGGGGEEAAIINDPHHAGTSNTVIPSRIAPVQAMKRVRPNFPRLPGPGRDQPPNGV